MDKLQTNVLELQQVICPSCRQSITSFSIFTTEVECPYCHNKAFNPLITAKKVPIPERIITFQTSEKDFERALVENLINRDYIPIDVFQCIGTGKVVKAYLPMFLYEGKFHSSWTCQMPANEVRATSDGKSENKTVMKLQMGVSEGNFAFLCLAHETKDIPEELHNFTMQFPYNAIMSKDFNYDLLTLDSENTPITLEPDTSAELIWNKYGDSYVNKIAEERAKKQLGKTDFQDFNASSSYQLEQKEGRLVMVPFWFVYYTYNNERHYFIMDGVGENHAMSTPINKEEVNFVQTKERIKEIIDFAWILAILIWFIFDFMTALISLGLWFIAKYFFKKKINEEIQAQLTESRAAREDSARKSGLI